jgi:hypothetical protein
MDMARRRTKNPQLRDRDWEVLEHVARYHLTIPEVLHRLFWEDDDGRSAVTKVTSRLSDHGYLNRHPFVGARSYFTLGPNGTRAFGIPKKRSEALGPQALCQAYGVLAFCCLKDEQRKRLLVREIQEINSAYLHRGVESGPYYIDVEEGRPAALAYLRVDCGGSADHVARKCKEDYEKRQKVPALCQEMEHDRFLIAVVTAQVPGDAKAAEIREALCRQKLPVRLRVESVPDLFELW